MAGVIGDREYNLRRVAVLFNGVLLSGADDGDFAVVTPEAPAYTHAVGARGEVAVSRSNNLAGTVTFRFYQAASSVIAIIEAAIRAASVIGLQEGTFISIEINDLNTGENLVMSQCWPSDQPTRNFGAEQQAREYVFGYAELQVLPR